MNAQSKPQKCQSDTSYCKFGSQTLIKLLEGFQNNIDGAIENKDAEFVHKTRVSTRKLRAALPLFKGCFPSKHFKNWSTEIKKVTRLLADARDLDVQIAFVEQYIKIIGQAEKPSLNLLLKDHKNQRKSVQGPVALGLENLKASGILEGLRSFCGQTISEQANTVFDPNQVMEKAFWHISYRLDDFLSMEKYVYLENEKLKHHEMRIYAKKLRYTMEIFSSLYKNKLSAEIENIKAYQDTLGEMHDCDVWLEYVPKFISVTETKKTKKFDTKKFEQALSKFLSYIKEKRKQNYDQFVHLWEENKKSNFFVNFRKSSEARLTLAEEKTKRLLQNLDVRVAFLSDIHANLHALERVLEDAQNRGVNVFVNAGDSIGFGPYPNETVELLCEKSVLSILGNYDLEVIEGKAKAKGEKKLALKFARKELSKSCECYLFSLPRELRLEVAGKKLLVTHGSPESIEEHIYHDTPKERLRTLANVAKADVVVIGHSHEQFWREANGTCFVNPGSVGRPGDGNPQAAYSILRFNPFKVELIRLDYNIRAAATALRKKGVPEIFAQMLLRGMSIDKIVKEDQAKVNRMTLECRETVEISEKIAQNYWPETEHYLQVTKLALNLFDGLSKLHHLGERERCWLECAAVLHDVGLSKSGGSHHKKSAKLILNDTQLPFASEERQIVASIARYHRKGLPKLSQYNLASLDQPTVHKINLLAALLRVADALDCTHQTNVKSLIVKVGTNQIITECLAESDSKLEEQAFNKKKDLFEKVFGEKLVLLWKKQ